MRCELRCREGDALGERTGFDLQLEEVLGVPLGRWIYDVWVAEGAATAVGGADNDQCCMACSAEG